MCSAWLDLDLKNVLSRLGKVNVTLQTNSIDIKGGLVLFSSVPYARSGQWKRRNSPNWSGRSRGKPPVVAEKRESRLETIVLWSAWLHQWFDVIKPWEPELVASKRFILLRIEGVPLHVWDEDFFRMISSLMGWKAIKPGIDNSDSSSSDSHHFDKDGLELNPSENNSEEKDSPPDREQNTKSGNAGNGSGGDGILQNDLMAGFKQMKAELRVSSCILRSAKQNEENAEAEETTSLPVLENGEERKEIVPNSLETGSLNLTDIPNTRQQKE
ncbi:unnamed protein product [Dovyalis caffra]|uniref:DUF4283 domain-containing protein n=1 Tax=Dovyalis caffra TaxID=77055 RepID=A0AAV1SHG0_9ROSI|nr:unnamed protein product [Dovyalis caffra]